MTDSAADRAAWAEPPQEWKSLVVVLEYAVPDNATEKDVHDVIRAIHRHAQQTSGVLTHNMTHLGIEDCADEVLALFGRDVTDG